MEPTDNPFAAPAENAGEFPAADESEQGLSPFVSLRASDVLHQVRLCAWVIGLFFSLVGINSLSWACQRMRTDEVWVWPSLVNIVAGSIVYLVPGMLLVRYGWRIGAYLKEGGGHTLQLALDAQRLFFQALAVLALCWVLAQIVMFAMVMSGVSVLV